MKHQFKAWALKNKKTGKLKSYLDFEEIPLLLDLPMTATAISMFLAPSELDRYTGVRVDVTVEEVESG